MKNNENLNFLQQVNTCIGSNLKHSLSLSTVVKMNVLVESNWCCDTYSWSWSTLVVNKSWYKLNKPDRMVSPQVSSTVTKTDVENKLSSLWTRTILARERVHKAQNIHMQNHHISRINGWRLYHESDVLGHLKFNVVWWWWYHLHPENITRDGVDGQQTTIVQSCAGGGTVCVGRVVNHKTRLVQSVQCIGSWMTLVCGESGDDDIVFVRKRMKCERSFSTKAFERQTKHGLLFRLSVTFSNALYQWSHHATQDNDGCPHHSRFLVFFIYVGIVEGDQSLQGNLYCARRST